MTDREQAIQRFGERIQRCSGCFVAFYLKNMWLAEDGSFYCSDCKDDSMFHFDQFSGKIDFSNFPAGQ